MLTVPCFRSQALAEFAHALAIGKSSTLSLYGLDYFWWAAKISTQSIAILGFAAARSIFNNSEVQIFLHLVVLEVETWVSYAADCELRVSEWSSDPRLLASEDWFWVGARSSSDINWVNPTDFNGAMPIYTCWEWSPHFFGQMEVPHYRESLV